MSSHIKKVKFTRVIEIKRMMGDRNSITNLVQYLHIALNSFGYSTNYEGHGEVKKSWQHKETHNYTI